MRIDARDGREGVPDGFCALAQAVYAGDGQWIPEDPQAVHAAFSSDKSRAFFSASSTDSEASR